MEVKVDSSVPRLSSPGRKSMRIYFRKMFMIRTLGIKKKVLGNLSPISREKDGNNWKTELNTTF